MTLKLPRVKHPPKFRGRHQFDPWVGKIPWRRAWQPTIVFLPGESHEQRSLAVYNPWGLKESDTTEHITHIHTHSSCYTISFRKQNTLHIL